MPRMIDLIRASAVPANLMQSAARGALSIPPAEMIEILVYLATNNKVFAEQASLTLAGWEESSSRAAASDPRTPKEVLAYLIAPENLRPVLLPALLGNPAVSEEALIVLAASATREHVEVLLKSGRVNHSPNILRALSSNANLSGIQSADIEEKISAREPKALGQTPALHEPEPSASVPEAESAPPPAAADASDEVPEQVLTAYLAEHASEISADAGKPFQPIGGVHDELEAPVAEAQPAPAAQTPAAQPAAAAAAQRAPVAKKSQVSATERGSALQKIAQLDVKGRIQLALKGSKEERSLLIRDGTKVVALAVLESPKIGESEVEKYASQKNVLEAVLRSIPLKRRFMKHYGIVRSLVFNPRTPLDVSLGLMKNILINDLKNLSGNKEVSDTVRKLALKMFKQKKETTRKN
jgi:hypothetical protein